MTTENNILVISVLFDYPEDTEFTFYGNLSETSFVDILRFNYNKSTKEEKDCFSKNVGEPSLYSKFFYYKTTKLLDHLKRVKRERSEIEYILFLDALDTSIIHTLDHIKDKFLKFEKNIVFCAESTSWPPTDYDNLYKTKNARGEMKYLNSGAYIGYIDPIIDNLGKGIDKLKDDQGAWAWAYLTNDDIEIDSNMELFFSTHENKNKVVTSEKNEYTFFLPSASIVHDNGPISEQTVKLVEYHKNNAPVHSLLSGCLIPTKLSKYMQSPPEWNQGATGLTDLILEYLSDDKPKTVMEVGSYFGESSFLFLRHGNIKKLVCVDPFIDNYDAADTSSTRLKMSEVKHVFQNNIIKRFSNAYHVEKESLQLSAEYDISDTIDMVYLDGNHNHDYVKKEIAHIIKICNPKILVGHDYNMVKTAVDGSIGQVDKVYSDYSWIKVL